MLETTIDTVRINFDTQTLWALHLALALVMFGIAIEISPEHFNRLTRHPKTLITGIVSQFFLLPCATFLLVSLTGPSPGFAMGVFVVAACPGGNVSNFNSRIAGANTALSSSLAAAATLLALVMTPLNPQFWGMHAPAATILTEVEIAPLEMIKLVALILGIPLFFGNLVNCQKPVLAKNLSGVFKLGALLSFITLVFMPLYSNGAIFLDCVFWLVVLYKVLAFISGFSIATRMGSAQKDRRTIVDESGIQNAGLCLLLIFPFFKDLGSMALMVVFWGIWHFVSGLVPARFWGFKPIREEVLA